MSRKSLKATRLKVFLIFLSVFFLALLGWVSSEVIKLKKSTNSSWFDPPTKIYTAPLEFKKMQKIKAQEISGLLSKAGLKERGADQPLGAKEFTFAPASICTNFSNELHADTRICFLIHTNLKERILIELSYEKILKIKKLSPEGELDLNRFFAPPLLIAQVSKNKHILRTYKELSQIPRYCLDGVLAIEDDRFLTHKGISPRGILRAAITNVKTGRFSQGGSTLTQQLVKNKFLSAEKTLTRKLKEAWLSILLEVFLDKDEILETYLNYIYFGRSGPYSVHGIQEASQLYFGKDVERLGLAECSLLAGAIKGPGLFGPHRPKRSKERQLKVLGRMQELHLISEEEKNSALSKEVSITYSKSDKKIQAPYYLDAVYNAAKKIGFKDLSGLSLYTEMDYFAQNALEQSLDNFLSGRSKGFLGSVLIGNNSLHSVAALASGTSGSLNFNSAIYGKRQIGSIAKPIVYLTALEQDGLNLQPNSLISNERFTYRYEGQTWTPKNYSNKNQSAAYPMYLALAKSKNIPTVRMMSQFGYKKVYSNMLKYGFSDFSPITPSLALGSFEASPLEVLKVYINLSKLNENPKKELPHFIRKIKSIDHQTLYAREIDFNPAEEVSPARRSTLEMMKLTLKLGTAQKSQRLNLTGVYGGKTGTTNNHNDGWFANISPEYTSVVWIGKAPYLTDKGYKITGASAALPIWMSFAKKLESSARFTSQDWPIDFNALEEDVEERTDGEKIKLLLIKKD